MKLLLAVVALAAALLGGAGVATWLVEQRLATLTPGGVTFDTLRYNPLTGRLVLRNVSGRDTNGREVASPPPIAIASTRTPTSDVHFMTLRRARVITPPVRLRIQPPLRLPLAHRVRHQLRHPAERVPGVGAHHRRATHVSRGAPAGGQADGHLAEHVLLLSHGCSPSAARLPP